MAEIGPTSPALVQMLARSGGRRLAAEFSTAGLAGLRPLHAPVLIPLLGGGRRASDLADVLGVSRQAVAQVIALLERDGYAKLVCLTRRGRQALRVLRATSLALEREWEAALGADRLAGFRATLLELLALRQSG
jgi:DNA-binding MarR family transcriptional regulator